MLWEKKQTCFYGEKEETSREEKENNEEKGNYKNSLQELRINFNAYLYPYNIHVCSFFLT